MKQSQRRVVITGATGNIGSRLVRALAGRPGVAAVVRDRADPTGFRGTGIEPLPGNLDDVGSLVRAFRGAQRVLLLTPFSPEQPRQERNAVEAARRAGTEHVVKVAALADEELIVMRGHAAGLRALRDAGIPHTVVRATAYMSNLLGQAPLIARGQLVFPYGPARLAWLHPQDLAGVLASLLLTDKPSSQEVVVSGPAALSFDELAAGVSAGVGREVTPVDVPPKAWESALVDSGVPGFAANALAQLFAWQQELGSDPVTDTLLRTLGRPGRSVADFVRETVAPAAAGAA
jgi:uncharacterized protein YbjT (DUF2867 family)